MILCTRVPEEVKLTKTESRMALPRTDGVRTGVTEQKSQLEKINKNLLGIGWWMAHNHSFSAMELYVE